jgi:hypothetical protein
MSALSKIFFPPKEANNFTLDRYLRAIESGEFRDLFNLGVCETDGGKWLLKDFTQEPNALFVGSMGSGKSFAACFTLATWLMSNSDKTVLFIADVSKGANDYAALFKYDQVYPVTGDGGKDASVLVSRVIDMVFSEVMARKDIFNEVQANSIKDYEDKTGKSLARVVIMLEEFHSIPYQIWEFERNFKKNHTIANKFHQLMRLGRSYGVFICAASQKSTKSDVPPEVVPNFTQKQIFKVSQGEAIYVLGNPNPALLTSAQKGRCYTEYGAVQFPYLPKNTQTILLDRYVKPLQAECAYLNPTLIKDYLEGKSTKDLYKLKKIAELAEAIDSFDGELVLQIIHEKIGNAVERLDSKTDNYGACMIVTYPNGDRRVVAYRSDSKIGIKTLQALSNATLFYKCSGAYLYCLGENLSPASYKSASDFGVKIFDHEDLKLIARQIDAGKIGNIRRLEEELANTNDVPTDFQEAPEKVREVVPILAGSTESSEASEPEQKYVDHNDLDVALLGDDPAILSALIETRKQADRRKRLDASGKKSLRKKDD